MRVELEVNGARRSTERRPWKRLLDVLREDLRLTGTKEGCGEGECGACTVLLDGEAVNSLPGAAGQGHGRTVVTVEGLAGATSGELSTRPARAGRARRRPVRHLHAGHRGVRAHRSAWAGERDGARARVRELLAGNICRCTGYQLIVDAVVAAADEVARGSRR